MQIRIFMLAALLSAADTQAATEFGETIPTEVAKVLMGLEMFDGAVYTDIPDNFPAFAMPQGMTVIGSVERRGGNQSVYLRANLDVMEARDALQQALQANGWHVLDFSGRTDPQAGFMGNGIRSIPSMLCHDQQGNLQINSQRSAQDTVVVVSRLNMMMNPGQTCTDVIAERQQSVARRDYFSNPLEVELPRLELPPEGSTGRPSGSAGGISSSGGNEIKTSTPMQISWDLPAVLEHFVTQVSAQGWTPQGEWDNVITAGGAWTRTAQSGAELLGILSVIRKAPGDYLLEFLVISTPRTGG